MGTPIDTILYTYGDDSWGDLLTAYDGTVITYDEIGNPLNNGTWTYSWYNGRELTSMTDGASTWNYVYDGNNMRISRSNGTKTYNYVYNGRQLVQMTVGNDTLYFTYNVYGPDTVTWNGEVYHYVVNGQGDVTSIFDESGTMVVFYNWDNAWGYNPYADGPLANTLGTLNPLRYRGYVYDTETGYYYLQSRYYDPEIGRFINADALVATGQGLLGHNMFAYCGNNPVSRYDPTGKRYCMVHVYDGGGGGKVISSESVGNTETDATISVGLSGNFSLGSIAFSGQLFISADTKGNAELQVSAGDGFSTGPVGFGLMSFITMTNAPDVHSLHGMGYQVGGTLGAGLGAGIDANFIESSAPGADYTGFTMFGGFATTDVHVIMAYTYPIVSIPSEFIDAFNNACYGMLRGS